MNLRRISLGALRAPNTPPFGAPGIRESGHAWRLDAEEGLCFPPCCAPWTRLQVLVIGSSKGKKTPFIRAPLALGECGVWVAATPKPFTSEARKRPKTKNWMALPPGPAFKQRTASKDVGKDEEKTLCLASQGQGQKTANTLEISKV